MARVTLRAFAALRELVGGTRQLDADDVAALLAQLRAEHGPEFDRRMQRARIMVGEQVVTDHGHELTDGDEVVLLPPFAGG